MTYLLLILFMQDTTHERIIPDVARVFRHQDIHEFRRFCDPSTRIAVDLRPMQFDHGFLSRDQTCLAFNRFKKTYQTVSAEVTEKKTDTNIARLEIHLLVELKERRNGHRQRASMVLQFRLTADRVVMIRWLLQKIH